MPPDGRPPNSGSAPPTGIAAAPAATAAHPPPVRPPAPSPPEAEAPGPRRLLTEAYALEGVRLGKDAREAVALAKDAVGRMDDGAVRDGLASLKDRKWALRQDGSLAPDPVPANPADPVRLLLTTMKAEAAGFRDTHPALAQVVEILAERAAQAGALAHAGLRARIAYAAQDVEKAAGKPLPMPGPLRAEMVALAATAPGLENGRMKALLAGTADIQDAGLVAAIRRTAADLAKAGEGQHGDDARERLEALEQRVRVQGPAPAAAATRPAMEAASPGPGPQNPPSQAAPPASTTPRHQEAAWAAPPPPLVQNGAAGARPASVAAGLMAAMRQPSPAGAPPWQTVTPGLGERVTAFETRMREGRTVRLLADASAAGDAAMRAVERFTEGPGRALLGKVEAAARAEGDSSAAVVAAMAPGAKHAALRVEFDMAMVEAPFAQAHREVQATLDAYGKARSAAGEDMQTRGLAASRLGPLERVDAALGEQASRIPGEKAGNSVLDEVAARVGEALREAAAKVAAAMASAAGVEARFSAGPSPAH